MIIMAESAHGTLRTVFLAPMVGDFAARQWGVLTGSLLSLFLAWLMAPWLGARDGATLMRIGLLWVALTAGAEIWIGIALDLSRQRMLEDYNPAQGGMLGIGMVFLACAPWLAAKLRKLTPDTPV